ncbi:13235_t:CDS:2 [Cetraspora pellucida]|uniref:13235_t:CDS:1 n=1 Tax=Cetraspora pellucida TaxID=1433469 RepID=A0A9N9ICF6_9GLOM|nr:13235_t:CDS:2 [Cetraspora pellucida]
MDATPERKNSNISSSLVGLGEALTSKEWPLFYSHNGIVNAKTRLTQQQSFNNFFDELYEKFNKKHLEILEKNNEAD